MTGRLKGGGGMAGESALLNRLEAICTRLETKASDDIKAQLDRAERFTAVLPEVRAVLEQISDSSDAKAHTRGPLARQVLALLEEF